jgi:hypothetical protein
MMRSVTSGPTDAAPATWPNAVVATSNATSSCAPASWPGTSPGPARAGGAAPPQGGRLVARLEQSRRPDRGHGLDDRRGRRGHRPVAARCAARRVGGGSGRRRAHQLPSHADRLRATGMLTLAEITAHLAVSTSTIKAWHQAGLLVAHQANDKNERLYQPPDPADPRLVKHQGSRLNRRASLEPSTGGAV